MDEDNAAFLSRLEFYELGFMWFASLLGFISQADLLFKCLKTGLHDQLSANVMLNMASWALVSFAGIWDMGYILLNFGGMKNAHIFFWLMTVYASFICTVNISILFLTLDRIFVLTRPTSYKKHRQVFVTISITACVGMFVFMITNLALSSASFASETACNSFTCLLKNEYSFLIYQTFKSVGSCVNLIFTVIFYIILYKYASSSTFEPRSFKRANILVSISVTTEFVFNFIPYAITSSLLRAKSPLINYLGLFPGVMFSADIIITALVYRSIINPKRMLKVASGAAVRSTNTNGKNQPSTMMHI